MALKSAVRLGQPQSRYAKLQPFTMIIACTAINLNAQHGAVQVVTVPARAAGSAEVPASVSKRKQAAFASPGCELALLAQHETSSAEASAQNQTQTHASAIAHLALDVCHTEPLCHPHRARLSLLMHARSDRVVPGL